MDNLAEEELKRADHLLYVSLKYTRTSEVIKSVIERLVSAQEISIKELLENLKLKKKIKEIPSSPRAKTDLLLEKIKDKNFTEFIDFHARLKRILKAEYKGKEEFRKNVTLIALDSTGIIAEVKVENLKEYFQKTKDFVQYLKEIEND
jgi:hypothetical protein